MRRAPYIGAMALLACAFVGALGCEAEPRNDAEPPRQFSQVTNNGRGWEHGYWSGADMDLGEAGGAVLRLSVPSREGPGVMVHRQVNRRGTFVDVTADLLPDEHGQHSAFRAGAFVDLNADGHDDILLVRDKGSFEARGYVFEPGEGPGGGRYRAAAFNRDLDFDGETIDGYIAFFGSRAISYHAQVLRVGDLDGDGDDDIFVGRRFSNYIYENLADEQDPWSADDMVDAAGEVVPRFRSHQLDSVAHDPAGPEWNSVLSNEMAYTKEAALFRADGREGSCAACSYVLAADSICVGDYCDDGWGVGADLYLHVYGPRGEGQACRCGNDVCEEGEVERCPADCLGDHAAEEISCTFVDHLRRQTDTSATAVATLDLAGDGSADDLIVFGGPVSADEHRAAHACAAAPDDCALEAGAHLEDLVVPNLGGLAFGPSRAAPAPFDGPYNVVLDAVSRDIDGDERSELVVLAPLSPLSDADWAALTVFQVREGVPVASRCPGLEGDLDAKVSRLLPLDLDGDGLLDFNLVASMDSRTYWGVAAEDRDQSPCLTLDRRVPTISRNLTRPTLVDVDNDGDLDVFMQGWADTEFDPATRVLLVNRGDGRFDDRSELLAELPAWYDGVTAKLDFDSDGDVDLLITQQGPMQLLENRFVPDREVRFVDASGLLPAWYTSGGRIHGADRVPCDPWPGYDAPQHRCYMMAMAVADFDGNGAPDVALGSKKGANDVLFNNVEAPGHSGCRVGVDPGCERAGFLSARTELGIRDIFGTTTNAGWGQANLTSALHAADFGEPDGRPDVLALASPRHGFAGAYDRLYANRITQFFPHARVCEADEECGEGGTCRGHGAVLPSLRTCVLGERQAVEGGFFEAVEAAVPPRGDGASVGPYGVLGCSAVADLDDDGRLDFFVVSHASEDQPDLDGVARLSQDPCSLFAGEAGDETECDVVFECRPWRCVETNPAGYQVEGPDGVRPQTDPACCQRVQVQEGRYPRPPCSSLSRGDVCFCEVRGYRLVATHGDGLEAVSESEVFAYLYDPRRGGFTRRAHPIALPPRAGSGSIAKSCAAGDLDGDGDQDLVVSGYTTANMPEAIRSRPPLPAGTMFWRRRHQSMQPTRVWLNPGWGRGAEVGAADNAPFTLGAFPEKSDKIYHLSIGDLDGDGALEIITAGADSVNLFDDH